MLSMSSNLTGALLQNSTNSSLPVNDSNATNKIPIQKAPVTGSQQQGQPQQQPLLQLPPTSSQFPLLADDTNKLKEFLQEKIAKRKKQIHPAHNPRFNHDLQLEIDCIEWALKKIEVNKLRNDRLEGVIQTMITDLEKRKDKP
jgi:hypothetical protein